MSKYIPLRACASLVSEKISSDLLYADTYISTENLQPNKQGTILATSLPNQTTNVTKYIGGDILIANIRPYLKKIWFSKYEGGCSADVLAIRSKSNINAEFLYYVLSRDHFFDYVMSAPKGTRMPRGDKAHILNYPVPNIAFGYQSKIAHLLSPLDKKIELNNRINAELEAMAKTLYDYWFVQFDFPDSNGKPYKTSGGKMVYNGILEQDIPEGWESKQLSSMTLLIRRGISPKYIEEGGICVLNQKCIRGQRILFEESRRHSGILLNNDERLLIKNDVVINSTGVGTLGRVAFVMRLLEQKTTVDSHVTIVRADSKAVTPEYLAWTMLKYQPIIESAANGSTGQIELNKSFLEDLDLILPAHSIQDKFKEFVAPLTNEIARRERENEDLVKFRDWLLPMLMNGQITIK